jgi:GTPase SAR1 family protein
MKYKINIIIGTIASIFGFIVAITTVMGRLDFITPLAQGVIGIIVGIILSFYISFVVKTLNKHPKPLKIAVVGRPRVGKTVFLTVLFDLLQSKLDPTVAFQAYGVETIEAVNSSLSMLRRGLWLQPTSPNSVFFYRANATIGRGFLANRYTVEVGDYAGEHLEEFIPSSELWLHKTDYFKYVLGADGIIFCLDGEDFAKRDRVKIQQSLTDLIVCFQLLLSEKGITADGVLDVPVAVVVLKSDLLLKVARPYVIDSVGALDSIRHRCKKFDIFFVSAVGAIDSEGRPTMDAHTHSVCDPMLWLLKTLQKV